MRNVVSSTDDPATTDSAGVLSALAAVKALTSARQNTASQTVLIIFCPRPASSMAEFAQIQAVKGRNKFDNMEGSRVAEAPALTFSHAATPFEGTSVFLTDGPIRLRN